MMNLQRKARSALSQHAVYQDDTPEGENSEEFVALGATGLHAEPPKKLRKEGSQSPPPLPRSPDDMGGAIMYKDNMPGGRLRTKIDPRGRPTPTSPIDVYGSHQTAQVQANYAAQWLQQQAYFPPGGKPGSGETGSEGREASDTPSSSGTGQLDVSVNMESDWPHSFMQSMGV